MFQNNLNLYQNPQLPGQWLLREYVRSPVQHGAQPIQVNAREREVRSPEKKSIAAPTVSI